MARASVWVVLLALGVGTALPPRMAAQVGGASSGATVQSAAPTAVSQLGRAPTESDIYCAGFFTHRAPDAGMSVLGSEDGGFKNEFGDRDFVYVSKGPGASPGAQYMLVRPVKDPNLRESFPGQQKMAAQLGTLFAEIARIQVRVVHEGSLTVEIMHACEPALAGDIAIPLATRSAPAFHTPKVVDRFAPSSGKATAVVVLGKEFRQNLGEDHVVYLNIGRSQGAQVGSYLRVFRTALSRDQDPFEQATRNYATDVTGQRTMRRQTRAERAALPRAVLGEILLLSVEDDSSAGIVTFSREEIYPGDGVELE